VYRRRILRGDNHFSWKKLGTFGADLAALSGFLDPPWRRPVAGLTEFGTGFVLNQAGLYLRALGRLAEAAQPMQAGLEVAITRKDWVNAAVAASNLSELTLISGDLAQALTYAQQSVDLAGRSDGTLWRLHTRVRLADALHQVGRLPDAEALFRRAEEMQKEMQPQYSLLYSVSGFQYCNLLLDQGEYQEVQSRAAQTLEWANQGGLSLLTIALDHLSLGRAHLLQARQEETVPSTSLRASLFTQAAAHLERAVDGLRQAGRQDDLPRGLLARAELRRVMGSLDRAQADLEEAMSISTRGGMRLHEADCHLEYARLHLACGEKEKARESLAKAKGMIEEMGYHRRDGEVAELERAFRGWL
jgi:tetratricopeptide (TPR) repeat protein